MTTTSPKKLAGGLAAVALAALTVGVASRSEANETLSVSELPRHTHIHGLAVDRQDPSKLLIASHHGLFMAGPNGKAERVSVVQDFMGFNPHPSDPNTLFASGHPAKGGNLGFIVSTDQGKTWKQVSPGVNGPADFHQMSASPADPSTIYGSYGGLQVSRDAGKTWELVGPTPAGLISLAASAKQADMLYAATETGLLVSKNAGKTWTSVLDGAPVSLVHVTPEGTLYAYVVGRGLVRSAENEMKFVEKGDDLGGDVVLHLAVDPSNPNRLFASTGKSRILTSTDQGRTWTAFGSSNSGVSIR